DVSDAQWRNFRGNLPILTLVFGIFTLLANLMRAFFNLNVRGMSVVWLLFSFAYLSYLHRACVIFVLSIATINFLLVKERSLHINKFGYVVYLSYLVYAPLYIAGPIVSFNAFASQLDVPQNSLKLHVAKVFADLALFQVLVTGMLLTLLASKHKYVHVIYMEKVITLKLCCRKLLSWAWLTCLFFIPELVLKSATKAFQAESSFGEFIFRELSAVAGAVTITCLMVANLVGFVVGPSGINWLLSSFLRKEGLPVLGGLLMTFYVGTKIMFHIEEAKKRSP
ncbi:hypothetical protein TSUD_344880, partial [Trifolium subterraneum]